MDIREYLHEKGMHQYELANMLGCAPKYLNNIINGVYKPSPKLARLIRENTGVEMEASKAALHKKTRRTKKAA